jgi:hypothetical protein
MTSNYRVIVHYHFKEGMEEQGIKFLERELIKKGQELGCHYIELWQNDRDASIIEGVAVWNNIEDARRFQSRWEKKEKELIDKYCTGMPEREFCKLRSTYMEKPRKAA